MKPSYRITEVAKLYGINPDTLRYYEEQGLLHPTRGENRYRMYGIDDICNLNVIRTLRELSIPIERIRRYTEERRCDTTLLLLDEQEQVIEQKLTQLKKARAQVRARRARLVAAKSLSVQEFFLRSLPARRGLSLRQNRIPSLEIDYALKKLESRHAELLRGLGSLCMGARLDGQGIARGDFSHYSGVFFLGEELRGCPVILPAGEFLCVVYAGGYENFPTNCRHLLEYAKAQGLVPIGDPIELYHIDAHDTDDVAEYRTEIQLLVGRVEE